MECTCPYSIGTWSHNSRNPLLHFSGGFIGKAPGRMKGTIEIVSYFGKDGAIGIIHSGSGFNENDLVEIY